MSIESRSRQYGKVFDHWQIKEFLGSGSGGKTAVFRLLRSDSSWGVSALKIVNLIEERGDVNTLSDFRRREYESAREQCSRNAEQEVRLMDDLRGNTNIVDYLDHTFVDWSDETGFGRDLLIRMELLQDLRSELRNGRIFSEREVLKIGRDICTALIRCHRKNILHRDVKPENIFRNKDGDYKLGDFGVSRVLDACPGAVASTGIGTYEYWPAEQMTGNYDKRVDIYSLGLVLYELSNQNRLPFAASTYATGREVSLRLSGAELPAPAEASPELAKVILKACSFKPEDRYQSAEALLKAINGVIRGLQGSVEQRTVSTPQEKQQEKKRYTTVTTDVSDLDALISDYKTKPANADGQIKKASLSTESVKEKAYATKPAEKHVPRYATQASAHKKKNTPSKVWIALLLFGFCMVMFSASFLFENFIGRNSSADRDSIQHETQEETGKETVSTTVEPTTEGTDIDWTETQSLPTPTEVIENTNPIEETTEPIYMQAIRVCTGRIGDFYGTPQQRVSEFDQNGYLVCQKDILTIDNSSSKSFYIYNDMILMDEVAAISGEGSTLSDSDRLARKDAFYSLLKHNVGYTGEDFPTFELVCIDENGYVVRYAVIYPSDDSIYLEDTYITFDEKTNQEFRVRYRDGVKTNIFERTYNEKNQVIRRDLYYIRSNSTEQYVFEYSYDTMGRRVQETETDLSNGVNLSYTTYTYDGNGTSYTKERHEDGGTVRTTVYKLDEFGNIIESIGFINGKQGYECEYTYETILIPSNQVEALCNTYDEVGVAYSIVEENG